MFTPPKHMLENMHFSLHNEIHKQKHVDLNESQASVFMGLWLLLLYSVQTMRISVLPWKERKKDKIHMCLIRK